MAATSSPRRHRAVAGQRVRPRSGGSGHPRHGTDPDVVLDMGWGRLVFGNTFVDPSGVLEALRDEASGKRDIACYVPDPQVLVGTSPHELFVDPSYTYRLDLHSYRQRRDAVRDVEVRTVQAREELEQVNRIYAKARMVEADVDTMWANQRTRTFTHLVALDRRVSSTSEDGEGPRVVGTVTGVDHALAFGDPEGGASMWCLAVDPDNAPPGTGEALVRRLAERYAARGRAHLDLSVLHSNTGAIALYRKLGFTPTSAVCVKRKNPINQALYSPTPAGLDDVNPYARIIADEALRRGLRVEVTDAAFGELRISSGARSVLTRESLSELTSAVAMSRCDDKRVTSRLLAGAGLAVPRAVQAPGTDDDDLRAARALLAEVGDVVVKPARGEQGRGITVGVTTDEALVTAVQRALTFCPDVIVEERFEGDDLRVVVIDHEVVAAAVRRPAQVVGTGRDSIAELVRRHSRRRAQATGGESTIPLDETTEAVVADAGYRMADILPRGEVLAVRRTANLHTGGTIDDVTDRLHPVIAEAARQASRVIGIPVTGLDFLVPDLEGDQYVIIEANERPGLANHEPQPTAERFVDLLFPETRRSA
ncbi:GNAT-family acetyltransferase TIGR03103 [Quadrisphaera granulorum]|uniref:GNAT-family acetyltransferase (TIGR03103 family) n=1 Tax=Quadrisphaera granulorum TaxID=317664 RepID=A0A315ZQ89_9ACTN|nr:N-acetylglutaminylglutamine synthetase [Quadrisphaera granulorum]PWJ47273.1 GNAT-family acetyltransferase (TIGR03103 family) [Quadrisphaera granulorum]SZE98844.1 GNAT-family acetyltransferase TIGR03103 [Quadrisphaera granulorum]